MTNVWRTCDKAAWILAENLVNLRPATKITWEPRFPSVKSRLQEKLQLSEDSTLNITSVLKSLILMPTITFPLIYVLLHGCLNSTRIILIVCVDSIQPFGDMILKHEEYVIERLMPL